MRVDHAVGPHRAAGPAGGTPPAVPCPRAVGRPVAPGTLAARPGPGRRADGWSGPGRRSCRALVRLGGDWTAAASAPARGYPHRPTPGRGRPRRPRTAGGHRGSRWLGRRLSTPAPPRLPAGPIAPATAARHRGHPHPGRGSRRAAARRRAPRRPWPSRARPWPASAPGPAGARGRAPQPLRQFGHHAPCPWPRTSHEYDVARGRRAARGSPDAAPGLRHPRRARPAAGLLGPPVRDRPAGPAGRVPARGPGAPRCRPVPPSSRPALPSSRSNSAIAARGLALHGAHRHAERGRRVPLGQVESVPQHHARPLAEREPLEGVPQVEHRGQVGIRRHALAALGPEERHPPPFAHRAAYPGRARFATTPRAYAAGFSAVAPPGPTAATCHQRVRGEIVRRVRLAGQQVGQPGEFGEVLLEERWKAAASSSTAVPTVTSSARSSPPRRGESVAARGTSGRGREGRIPLVTTGNAV